MTTTYKTIDYTTTESLREALNSDLAALAYPYQVVHKYYGEGQLTFVKAPQLGGSLYATINFATCSKTIALDVAFTSNLLTMPDILADILLEAQTVFKADFLERGAEQRLADRLAREQAIEAENKAKAAKAAEEKYEKTKAKAIRDFENLTTNVVPKSTADEFYYSLGWLAKHVGSVSAKLPDYLSDSFVRHFGADATFNAIDSKKKTVNGNAMQWTFGFTATLRKPDNIPAFLSEHVNEAGSKVSDTSFIWDLVDNYGFKFGKTQDLDQIRSHVPSDKLSFFEAGLA